MFIATIAVVPGSHIQFQLWYQEWIPFLYMLTDTHPIFWLSNYIHQSF